MEKTLGAHCFWRLWGSSLLWAIPATYLVCTGGTVAAFVVGMTRDGHPDAFGDYVYLAGVGVLWGTIIFIGTCYITVPMFSVIIAIIRYALWRRQRKRDVSAAT